MWYQIASASLGYCLAAMFSANVSLTFSATIWSVWTIIVLLFWWLVSYFLLFPVIMAILFGFSVVGLGGIVVVVWILDKVKRR